MKKKIFSKKEIKEEKRRLRKEWKNIIFNVIFAILTISIVILFYDNLILTTILLLAITMGGLLKWKSRRTIILFILGAIFGAFSEVVAINYGVWAYAIPNFMEIPIWLFIVWGNATAFIYQSSIEIRKLGVKEN